MKRFFKTLCIVCCILSAVVFSFVIYGEVKVPDSLTVASDEEISFGGLFRAESEYSESKEVFVPAGENAERQSQVKFLNVFPVKKSLIKTTGRQYVIPGGEIIGIRIYTDGVIVVSADNVQTPDGIVNPGKGAGLEPGDIIKSVNGTETNSAAELNAQISKSSGEGLKLSVSRAGRVFDTVITPVYSDPDSRFRCGLWVRDSTAGLGTVTYIDPQNGTYGALGHGICDTDTGIIIPTGEGNVLSAQLNGCIKGQSGKTGELQGSFGKNTLGDLKLNCQNGIFGKYTAETPSDGLIEVAEANEIRTGPAQIIATVDNSGKKYYDIEIERINYDVSDGSHNFTIKVTDEELINLSGGIVQGMSGSPIIQDGRLAGAVTHVFLNDPQYGYGIFARTMLDTDRSINNSSAA